MATIALALPVHSFAALGDKVTSIQADQAHMRASARVAQKTAYGVTELQSPSGTVVREYVSPAGTVFGVTWQGPALPDLRQVLGTYFDTYVQTLSARRRRGPRIIRAPGLVVQVGGHQRAFRGRVFVPNLVPAGVGEEEMQ